MIAAWVLAVIETSAMIMMFLGTIYVFRERREQKKGLGARSLQHIALFIIGPVILILGLEGVLSEQALTALLGGLVGYILANVGNQ